MADPTGRAQRLQTFVDWCDANIRGDEKGEAQVFVDRLLQGFGQPGAKDVGGEFEHRVRKKFEDQGGVSFADYVWKPRVLIEMKKRGADLSKHFRQAFDYWMHLVPDRPRYVILCNFDEFWVYDFDTQIDAPKDKVALADLPSRYSALAFLFPTNEKPLFEHDQEKVTRDVASHLAALFRHLVSRKVDRDLARRFTLQSLVALFAEDIGLLEDNVFARLIEQCQTPQDSYDLIGGLFAAMNSPNSASGGRYRGVRYFNGGIFADPARLELEQPELTHLHEAARADWSAVRPEIFGAIFEQSMHEGERHAFGAHFTYPSDIMKIVKPTIVDPWTDLIENARSLGELDRLRLRMLAYRVLDPACGSGNFLYIAYRELRRLENRLNERYAELAKRRYDPNQFQFSHISLRQFYGMDINPFAVELAKVTLLIGHKLAVDEFHSEEAVLPLDNLDANFRVGDALIRVDPADPSTPLLDDNGRAQRTDWFPAEVVIGNPPFLGAKRMKPERGDAYVSALRKAYPEVPGMADYCVYWIRRTAELLPPCTPERPEIGRAGLVGTQNIRNNKSREGGLDRVVEDGTIVEAVDNQPWSGEAAVHVSIVNWVKSKDQAVLPDSRLLWFVRDDTTQKKTKARRGDGPASKRYDLDKRVANEINSSLSDEVDVSAARVLRCNTEPQRVFNGQYPRNKGFRIPPSTAQEMLSGDLRNSEVIKPFLVGDTMLTVGRPTEFIIDFGLRHMQDAATYPIPFAHVERIVYPHIAGLAAKERSQSGREQGQDQGWLQVWWQHFRSRPELKDASRDLSRYIACVEVTKRPIFCFVSTGVTPDKTLYAFAFEDDYTFGVVSASSHWEWFGAKSSKFEKRPRYTPSSVWDTYPFPQSPDAKRVDAVADAAREVRRVRDEYLPKMKGGLRALYRTLDKPGKSPLRDAHHALDEAVLGAYGFSSKKNLLTQLLALNQAVASRLDTGEPVTAPGIPSNYPEAKRAALVTQDCIQPPEV